MIEFSQKALKRLAWLPAPDASAFPEEKRKGVNVSRQRIGHGMDRDCGRGAPGGAYFNHCSNHDMKPEKIRENRNAYGWYEWKTKR
jgi:hypothetical protein